MQNTIWISQSVCLGLGMWVNTSQPEEGTPCCPFFKPSLVSPGGKNGSNTSDTENRHHSFLWWALRTTAGDLSTVGSEEPWLPNPVRLIPASPVEDLGMLQSQLLCFNGRKTKIKASTDLPSGKQH